MIVNLHSDDWPFKSQKDLRKYETQKPSRVKTFFEGYTAAKEDGEVGGVEEKEEQDS